MGTLPQPQNDGLTHINVYSRANTELGRFLSNFNGPPVDTERGRFNVVEGYWHWLHTPASWDGRDAFQTAGGWEAKRLSKRVKAECDRRPVDEKFKRLIGRAVLRKILNAGAEDVVPASDLPFAHYYMAGDRQIRGGHQWLMGVLEHIRRILRDRT